MAGFDGQASASLEVALLLSPRDKHGCGSVFYFQRKQFCIEDMKAHFISQRRPVKVVTMCSQWEGRAWRKFRQLWGPRLHLVSQIELYKDRRLSLVLASAAHILIIGDWLFLPLSLHHMPFFLKKTPKPALVRGHVSDIPIGPHICGNWGQLHPQSWQIPTFAITDGNEGFQRMLELGGRSEELVQSLLWLDFCVSHPSSDISAAGEGSACRRHEHRWPRLEFRLVRFLLVAWAWAFLSRSADGGVTEFLCTLVYLSPNPDVVLLESHGLEHLTASLRLTWK